MMPKETNDNKPKLLILDIETKLIPLLAFGIRDQYIDIKQIVDIQDSARLIHCIGLKWAGERKVTVLTEWDHGYSEMIRQTRDMIDEADAVIGFNHENFDMTKMRGQFALEGISYPKPPTNIDIFKTVRKMGFPSSKLDYIAQAFGIGKKVKHPGMEMWRKVLEGCPQAQKTMARYCAGDVRLTEQVYNRLLPYIENHPRIGNRHGLTCPNCGGDHVTSQGWKITRTTRVQSIKCQSVGCGSWFQGKRERIAA
jgi:DNA polymerase elongation subunit (family B)